MAEQLYSRTSVERMMSRRRVRLEKIRRDYQAPRLASSEPSPAWGVPKLLSTGLVAFLASTSFLIIRKSQPSITTEPVFMDSTHEDETVNPMLAWNSPQPIVESNGGTADRSPNNPAPSNETITANHGHTTWDLADPQSEPRANPPVGLNMGTHPQRPPMNFSLDTVQANPEASGTKLDEQDDLTELQSLDDTMDFGSRDARPAAEDRELRLTTPAQAPTEFSGPDEQAATSQGGPLLTMDFDKMGVFGGGPVPTPADPSTKALAQIDLTLMDDDEQEAAGSDVPLLPFTKQLVSKSTKPSVPSTAGDATKWNGTQRWDPLPNSGQPYRPDTPWMAP